MKEGNIVCEMSFDFSLKIIGLYKILQEHKEYILSKQLLRSATSVGANVEEAIAAQSKKDFISKMSIASKEARECRYWLRLLDKSKLVDINYLSYLEGVQHLINILTKIVKTSTESSHS